MAVRNAKKEKDVTAQELTVMSNEQIEAEMRELHSSIDKLTFAAVMLAIGARLPEEFVDSEFDHPNALQEIIPHIEELEKVIKEPNYPMNYMAYDLKSYGVVVTNALMNPEMKTYVEKEMLGAYERGKHSSYRIYTVNWDRCYNLKYTVPEAGRLSLPLFSEILAAIASGNLNFYDQPYLAITTMINWHESAIEDLGQKYRDILRIEEDDMSKKVKSTNRKVKSTYRKVKSTNRVVKLNNRAANLQAKVKEATKPVEVIDAKNNEAPEVPAPNEMDVPEINESSAQELKDEFQESLLEEVTKMAEGKKIKNLSQEEQKQLQKDMAKAVPGEVIEKALNDEKLDETQVKEIAAKAAIQEAAKAIVDGGDVDLESLLQLDEEAKEVTKSPATKGESCTKDDSLSTGEKILLGIGGTAVVGGIGYGIYRFFKNRNGDVDLASFGL